MRSVGRNVDWVMLTIVSFPCIFQQTSKGCALVCYKNHRNMMMNFVLHLGYFLTLFPYCYHDNFVKWVEFSSFNYGGGWCVLFVRIRDLIKYLKHFFGIWNSTIRRILLRALLKLWFEFSKCSDNEELVSLGKLFC